MPSEATINKYTNELLALYIELYSQKYDKAPVMNRFKQKWGFRGMYEDLGLPQAKKVINHYFKTPRVGHPIDYLLYNYEKLNQILIELERDARDREELRKETEQRVREWEARGNK